MRPASSAPLTVMLSPTITMASARYVVTASVVPKYLLDSPTSDAKSRFAAPNTIDVPLIVSMANHGSSAPVFFEISDWCVSASAALDALQAMMLSRLIVTDPGSEAAYRATDWIAAPSAAAVSTVIASHVLAATAGILTVLTAVAPAVSEHSASCSTFAASAPDVRSRKLICWYALKSVDAPRALYAIKPVVKAAATTRLALAVPSR